jgi:predicted dehydrogenase
MAHIQLPPPDRFNFRNPDDWPRWRRRFQKFREASGLSGDSAAKQISTLLYCLGEEAESVLVSTNATEEDHAHIHGEYRSHHQQVRRVFQGLEERDL